MIKFEDLIRYLLHRQKRNKEEKEYEENKRRELHKKELREKLESSWDDEIWIDNKARRKINHNFLSIHEKKKELFGTNIHIFSPEEQEDLSKYLNEEYEAYQKDQEAKGPLIKKL